MVLRDTRASWAMLAPQFLNLLGRDVFSAEELKARNERQMRMSQLMRLGLEAERRQAQAE